ncbi:MAG: hypothetical protein ABIV21_07905 [Pyrinomonadaceae bacterium]
MPTSICPECSEEVFVEADAEQGDNIVCEECSAKLVVVGLDPIELDPYEESDAEGSPADDFQSLDYDDDKY